MRAELVIDALEVASARLAARHGLVHHTTREATRRRWCSRAAAAAGLRIGAAAEQLSGRFALKVPERWSITRMCTGSPSPGLQNLPEGEPRFWR
jgi:hypothetical protein